MQKFLTKKLNLKYFETNLNQLRIILNLITQASQLFTLCLGGETVISDAREELFQQSLVQIPVTTTL